MTQNPDTQTPDLVDEDSNFTRLYIAGFPKYLNEARLRSFAEKFGKVSDVSIKKTPEGKSREFGFIGYERHEDAKKALKALNSSFIDTRRIHVKKALGRGANELRGTAWSPWTKGEESFKKVKELEKSMSENSTENIKNKRKSFYEKYDVLKLGQEDAQLRDYLGLAENKNSWRNDLFENDEVAPEKRRKRKTTENGSSDSEDYEDDDQRESAPRLPLSNKSSANLQSTGNDSDFEDDDPDANPIVSDGEDNNDSPQRAEKKKAELESLEKKKRLALAKMSDDDFLKSIQKDEDGSSSDEEEEKKDEVRIIELPSGAKKRIVNRNIDVMETGRLFIRNLGYSWSEQDIYDMLGGYGNVSAVHFPVDQQKKCGVGFAFATFMFPEDAKRAMEAIDGSSYKGRIIQVLPAEHPRDQSLQETMERDDLSYKQKLEAKRKAEKENKITWNALFMRGDTIAENMATQIGVEKRDFLGDASRTERMAVKMAKAEVELIKQTQDALKAHGVDFSVLSKVETTAMRSKNSLLIKNLPPNTNATEIEELFRDFGQIEKVVLPPAGTIALVKYYHNNDAKRAFNKNAFRKFKNVPLFLEWAPQVLLTQSEEKKEKAAAMALEKSQSTSTSTPTPTEKQVVRIESKEEENPESATLFISNVNFQTSEDELRQLFQTCGSVVSVRMLKGRREDVHKGAGFVAFSNLKDAAKAHEKLQNYILDGHAIVIRYSNVSREATKEEKTALVDGKTLTFKKIIVKNLAFQATKKEIYQLFSQYGKIETVRLPMKVAGGHRGFAFVEFISPEECHAAYESLKHAHLYGRHLVLQYAADDTSLESAQKRARERMEENSKIDKSLKMRRREFDL